MPPRSDRRPYSLARRAETKAETRQRIVEATSELHGEVGISGTTMRAIAARAGVSIATVYKHFPNYEEAIRACGEMAMQAAPPPDERIFIGRSGRQARVAAFVEAFFRYRGPRRGPALRSGRRVHRGVRPHAAKPRHRGARTQERRSSARRSHAACRLSDLTRGGNERRCCGHAHHLDVSEPGRIQQFTPH